METILHIGTDKTGSTAIQRALWTNREWFLQQSIYIPQTGLGVDNGHAALLETLPAEGLAALSQELKGAQDSGFKTALISWEGMCRFRTRRIKMLLDALPTRQHRILVYLREQAEIIQSAHLQWVKMNPSAVSIESLARPRSLFEKMRRFLFLRHPHRNYHALILRWQHCSPQAAFCIRPFQKDTLINGDVVSDFLAQAGADANEGFQSSLHLTNPSMDVETAILLEQWRAQKLPTREIDTQLDLAEAIAALDTHNTRHFFDESSVRAIRRHFAASNAALANIISPNNPHNLFTSRDCWLTEPFTAVTERATRRQHRIAKEGQVPTLMNTAAGAALPDHVALLDGWSDPEPWGVWSCEDSSTLRYRVPLRHLAGNSDTLEIQLLGKYYADNKTTRVLINDVEMGQQDLSALGNTMRLPMENLQPLQRVTIELSHQHPTSPADHADSPDTRKLAFALTAISCQPIKRG